MAFFVLLKHRGIEIPEIIKIGIGELLETYQTREEYEKFIESKRVLGLITRSTYEGNSDDETLKGLIKEFQKYD